MSEPSWFAEFQGKRPCGSQLDGQIIQRHHLVPLRAAISLMFGSPDADLNTLNKAGHKLSKGEPIVCESCGVELLKGQDHKQDCALAKKSMAVLAFAEPWTVSSLAHYRHEWKLQKQKEGTKDD